MALAAPSRAFHCCDILQWPSTQAKVTLFCLLSSARSFMQSFISHDLISSEKIGFGVIRVYDNNLSDTT